MLIGRHFPTDVIAAAAIGSLIGVLVPWLHQRAPTVSVGGAVVPGGATANVTVTLR